MAFLLIIYNHRGYVNLVIFTLSSLLIISTHLFAFTLINKKEEIKISKPKYQKISMQLAQIKKSEPIKKESVKEKTIKKEVFDKRIKKDAKRKLIKKLKKKKSIKKKEVKKRIEKKEIKKVPKKEIIKNAPVKKVKVPALKDTSASLVKYKQFKENYMTKLRKEIDKNKKYPNTSRRLKEEGKVIVSFRVLKNGQFTNMRILKGSSKKRLNKAALNALLLTNKFEPFSKELKDKEFIDFTLAMRFSLK